MLDMLFLFINQYGITYDDYYALKKEATDKMMNYRHKSVCEFMSSKGD